MIIIMKEMLCNPLGVFMPGDEYEASEKDCNALISHGYAFDPSINGPEVEAWDGAPKEETTEAEPKEEVAAKKVGRPRKLANKRGRPRKQ